jgi:hypothetical protein
MHSDYETFQAKRAGAVQCATCNALISVVGLCSDDAGRSFGVPVIRGKGDSAQRTCQDAASHGAYNLRLVVTVICD